MLYAFTSQEYSASDNGDDITGLVWKVSERAVASYLKRDQINKEDIRTIDVTEIAAKSFLLISYHSSIGLASVLRSLCQVSAVINIKAKVKVFRNKVVDVLFLIFKVFHQNRLENGFF